MTGQEVRVQSRRDGIEASRGTGQRTRPPVRAVSLPVRLPQVTLSGDLAVPGDAVGLVLFAHGSGSGRLSPRNRAVADILNQSGLATLLFDFRTRGEEVEFNLPELVERLTAITGWVRGLEETKHLGLGYFGCSTGAAVALVAATALGPRIQAIVSRGGRPDLAPAALPLVEAPTLLIVGGEDDFVLKLNREAYQTLRCPKRLSVVAGAGHLFEEPGALDEVGRLAATWFRAHLHPVSSVSPGAAPREVS